MSITYNMYKGEDSKKAADIALKNRLYVSGWDLSQRLKAIRSGKEPYDVALAFDGETPVGVTIIGANSFVQNSGGRQHIQVFVRKKMRRHGIGSSLVAMAKEEAKVDFWAYTGAACSPAFWTKNKVDFF